MSDVFIDHVNFMHAGGQTTGILHKAQVRLYGDLVLEEADELDLNLRDLGDVIRNKDAKQIALIADAALDTIVVAVGVLHSLGLTDPAELWEVVKKKNYEKVDSVTGKILKREDGKVLKPEGWTPPEPELEVIIERQLGW